MKKKNLLIPLLLLVAFTSLSSQAKTRESIFDDKEQKQRTENNVLDKVDYNSNKGFQCDGGNLDALINQNSFALQGGGNGGVYCNDKQIKYIRINIHYMLNESITSPGNFTETNNGKSISPDVCYTGYDYARDLLHALNWSMARNFEPGHPVSGFPNDYDQFPPKRIKFIMDGIFFHRDNDFDRYPDVNANMHYNIYGENQENVYNVYLTSWTNSGTSDGRVLTGVPKPSVVVNSAWYYSVYNNQYFNEHSIADRIVHELGHLWGLCHSFYPYNPCDDINTEANCNGNPSPTMGCFNGNPMDENDPSIGCAAWDGGDNNLMGYNPHATNITVCQLEIIHSALQGTQSAFVASCCDNWTFIDTTDSAIIPPRNTKITMDCDPQFCIIPNIIPRVEDNEEFCSVCFRVEEDETPSIECVQWSLSFYIDAQIENPYSIITGSGLEICADIPDGHTFELCMTFCGYDEDEVETCWSRQTCSSIDEARDVLFNFIDEDENERNVFMACEDIFIDARATALCDSEKDKHYFSIWKVVEDEELFLAWTGSMLSIPTYPTNISNVLESYPLYDGGGTPISSINLEPGAHYILQLGVSYSHCGSKIKTRHEFFIRDKIIDFHFEDDDGIVKSEFDICEDIYINTSAIDGPIDLHRYTLFELDGNQETFKFWIPNTSDELINPTNLSTIFQVPQMLDGIGQPLESFEYECDKTYRLQLAVSCEGYTEVVHREDFTIICEENCEPCPSLIPTFEFGINKSGDCILTFYASGGAARACYEWEVTSTLSDGTTQVTNTSGPTFISIDPSPLQNLEVCLTTCDQDCDYFEGCLTLTEEMISKNCDQLGSGDDGFVNTVDINLSPNPVNDQMTISLTDGSLIELYIIDINGFLQKKYPLPSVESTQISIGYLKSGNYKIIATTSDNAIITKSFVKL